MDIPVHNQILWRACEIAAQRLAGKPSIGDPRVFFPLLSRGSWMNDTNQVTVLSDAFTGKTEAAGPQVKNFLQAYWQLELGRLIDELRYEKCPVAEQARLEAIGVTDVDEFGSYRRFDHLDVLEDAPKAEYDASDRALTVQKLPGTVRDRISYASTNPGERLNGRRLTALGRALHTLQDFYAHTNWVELLLWNLARRTKPSEKLDGDVVTAFARADPPFTLAAEDPFHCPLPLTASAYPRTNAVMWYGPDPQSTPLVSTVFDTKDTACSLLNMYARHLVRVGRGVSVSEEIDLVLSILDVSGMPMAEDALRILIRVGEEVGDILRAVGAGARAWLASYIEGTAARMGDFKGALQTVAGLLRSYDTKEAGEWARAGRLRYVAYALKCDIAASLNDQTPNEQRLPHHTLLAKDHPTSAIDDMVRYQLACFFATELSAAVLEWHFSSAPPGMAWFDGLCTRWLVHPSGQLDSGVLVAADMSQIAHRFFGQTWWGLTNPTAPVIS